MLLGLVQSIKNRQDRLPIGLALGGAIVYFLQSLRYAFTLLSVEDEGGYLLKGYWYVTGQYIPFQDYGPFTNHMPLAFLIPGYIQQWFGTGLRSGRFFAVFLGLLFLVGLWLLVRRLAGQWWAAAAVWAIAVNPALIKMYSVAVSQGLVAAMLIWILYFALGKERSPTQVYLGTALAAALALTRLNMTPVLLLLLVYFWWQHGPRRALIAAAIGLGVTALGYASYWPGVLRLWATYTPEALSPFLAPWRLPPEALPSWISGTPLLGRLLSFIEAWRFNFLPFLAALVAWLFWPSSDSWRDKYQRRDAMLISALLALLFVMHAIASLASNYCVFCFPLYSAFFSFLGLLLFVLVWPRRSKLTSQVRKLSARVLMFLLPALVSFGSYILVADKLPPRAWVRALLILELPRFSGFSSLPGTIPLWGLLENRFALDYEASFRALRIGMGYAIMLLLGIGFGLALNWFAKRARDFLTKNYKINISGFANAAMLTLLLTGFLLSPAAVLGGGYSSFDCDENVIAAYERIGEELSSQIPTGAQLFWRGGRSPVPLLYLDNVQFPPAQVNGDYTYRLAGQADDLQRFGMWGPSVLEDWLQTADYILVEEDLYRTWLQAAMDDGPYELLYTTDQLVDCSPQSQVLIYTYRPD